MNRRSVLVSIGAGGTVAIAGCAGQGNTDQQEEQGEQGTYAEPESKAPRIQRVELVTEWENPGDIADNAIESTTVGSDVAIGISYDYWQGGGTHAITGQAEIVDENGERYQYVQDATERLTDLEGWTNWRWSLPFSTDGASPGEYEAIVQIRDDYADKTSETVSTTFNIEE